MLESAKPGDEGLLPSAAALAVYDPGNAKWDAEAGKVAQTLVTISSISLGPWLEALRPARTRLTPPVAAIFRDKSRPETVHSVATEILADYASDDPNLIADLLMDADHKSYAAFFPIAQAHEAKVIPLFQAEIAKKAVVSDTDRDIEAVKDRLAERQARAAVGLVRMGKAEEVWPLLRHGADPRLRSFIVNWLNPLGADPKPIAAELNRISPNAKPTPAQGQQFMDTVLFHPETSMRRGLILALGSYGADGLSPGDKGPLISTLLDLYRNDPDAGIHGAVEWTLRQWKNEDKLKKIDAELSKLKNRGERRWFVNRLGQTFTVVDGPVDFLMGSPPTEPDRESDETPHRVVIPRRFAIATKEVSWVQFSSVLKRKFVFNYNSVKMMVDVGGSSANPNHPMGGIPWHIAAAFCNWLSEQDGLPKDQRCYIPTESGGFTTGMTIPADVLQRKGYRLPTEAEWEYACRSGTMTSRYYGHSPGVLDGYARYHVNSNERRWACGSLRPNDLGLFDMLGNAFEWVHDRSAGYGSSSVRTSLSDDISISESVSENERILRSAAWDFPPASVRSASRFRNAPTSNYYYFGFRLCRTYP